MAYRSIGVALTLAAAQLAAPRPGAASSSPVPGVIVHSSEEVARLYVTQIPGGGLVFHAPDGSDWPLLADAAQLNLKDTDGRFHPMATADVEAAIAGIRYPMAGQHFEVFILPYPREDLMSSAAGSGCVFLAPGIREYTAEEVHFVTSHEIGHLVQAALMPESDTLQWNRYRALRGITNTTVYSRSATHALRPHEIFAEDFRFLFGDDMARYTGGIENSALELPTAHPEVRAFFLALAGPQAAALPLAAQFSAGPNPFTSSTRLTFLVPSSSVAFEGDVQGAGSAVGSQAKVRLEVFDMEGRRVRSVADAYYSPGTYTVAFDGQDEAGRRLPGGIWFARLQVGSRVATRKLTLFR